MKKTPYERVTETILEQLRQGVIPWRKPWAVGASTRPRNLVSRSVYTGSNWLVTSLQGYASPFWLTWKQIQEVGGLVRKGEKSTYLVRMGKWVPADQKKQRPADEWEWKTFLRGFAVWNTEQIDGIEELVQAERERLGMVTPTEMDPEAILAESLAEAAEVYPNMPERPGLCHQGNQPCYVPSQDRVLMPSPEQFFTPEGYYSTLFHELGHSTKAEHRCNRKDNRSDPDARYAFEELVAELSAAMVCAEVGISPERTLEDSASYIDHWLRRLENDSHLVIQAASHASKASDFILGRTNQKEKAA